MEAAIDFKSLRAKFQEEQQSKEKPFIAEKPKRFQAIPNSDVEAKPPAVPPFSIKDELKQLSEKKNIFVPSSFIPPDANRNGVTRHSLKNRHLPLVLPTSMPSSLEATPFSKLVTSPIKCKKKLMPTPFKPSKFSKSIKDILENAEHLISESHSRSNHHSWGSNSGSSTCPSPEQPSTPSSTSEDMGSVPHGLSTLEKAKKRFSPKNLLVYARPKSFYCSKEATENLPPHPPPPLEYENFHREPGCRKTSLPSVIPNLLKTNGVNLIARLNGDMKPAVPDAHPPLLVKVLPDKASLGPSPSKPPRPPHVDLTLCSTQMLACEIPACFASLKLAPASHPIAQGLVVQENQTLPPPPPHFEIPDLSNFTTSVLEALNSNKMSLPALELEVANFGAPPLKTWLPKSNPEEATTIVPQEPQKLDERVQKRSVCPAEACGVNPPGPGVAAADFQSTIALEAQLFESQSLETMSNGPQTALMDSFIGELPSEPSLRGDYYTSCDNIYEEVESIRKFSFSQNSRKRKGPPKNPYAKSPGTEESRRSLRRLPQWAGVTAEFNGVSPAPWDRTERSSPDHHEEKEMRKREKQRLERERKEQKEREKKENEMKKKFKITGYEEPMYHARVLQANKLHKHHLQVKSGDTVSIIRTTNCPKGKWLARDGQNKYGYISVMNVELNMKEMLELGKRVSQSAGRGTGEADTLSLSSRSSHHNPVLTSSFTDDSEEWTCDDETLYPLPEVICLNRSSSMPDVSGGYGSSYCAPSAESVENIPSEVKHEALQKLATFFQNPREDLGAAAGAIPTNTNGPGFLCAFEAPPYIEEDQFSSADVGLLLPPPELYADSL